MGRKVITSPEMIAEIKHLYEDKNYSMNMIARKFRCSYQTIYRCLSDQRVKKKYSTPKDAEIKASMGEGIKDLDIRYNVYAILCSIFQNISCDEACVYWGLRSKQEQMKGSAKNDIRI